MCTALSLTTKDHYFGRNLDLSYSYQESVVVVPRRFPLPFRRQEALQEHLAMIGVATVIGGYPLFYDATNETGLSMAGLNFPGNAVYAPEAPDKDNVSPFEFIPWILGQCDSVAQARALLSRMNLADVPFSAELPLSPLHWMISDKSESIVVESTADGLHIHDNPAGVMTNNPPLPFHLQNLTRYRGLSSATPQNTFAPQMHLIASSIGAGTFGLPGDFTSESRFARAAYLRAHSLCDGSEAESVRQFFHILGNVRFPCGSVIEDGHPEITVYSSCCNASTGVYYYVTHENSQITAVDMHSENLAGNQLSCWPLRREQTIRWENR